MSNIKVVDINNEEAKQEEAIQQPNEEVKEEVVNEVVEEPPQETANGSLNSNSVGVETNEVIEEETKEQPKVKAQDRMVRCPKCNKEMKYKNFRYGHQQKCQGGIENKPVKPHTKARAKPKPIIKQVEVNEQPQEVQQQEAKPVVKHQIPQQPSNPLMDITNHYQLLQNQFIQQKKEKYNNLCQNMFAPKSKKRR